MTQQATEERALRADAQRNLARILDAAREVFAEEGLQASVADVAEQAGVGTATIFRRFPTKDDLLAAIVVQRMQALAESARQATAAKDPGRAWRQFVQTAASFSIQDRAFYEATDCGLTDPRLAALVTDITDSVGLLLERARAAGEVREGITTEDVAVIVSMVAHAGLTLEPVAPGHWRRYLDIVLDGLRPEGARPLSRRPISRRQLDAAKRRPPR
jgi:AcrR family transcriptional regulator